MPAGTKAITRRIKSVTNTKKITKAMEMVSVAKMRRATDSVLATRPYSNLAWQIIGNISKSKNKIAHPLLEKRSGQGKIMVILITSDKGLCGSFNSQMFREIKKFVLDNSDNNKIDFVVAGKRGELFALREKMNITATFEDLLNKTKFTDIKPVAKLAMNKFVDKTYDKVYVAYTDYISTLNQKARVRQLLPIIQDDNLGDIGKKDETPEQTEAQKSLDYIFEPQKKELLEMLLPKIVETQIFQAILESVASEHSARMVAMKNATDAANEMVDDLTLTFNKLRQAGITREISEISAGKAALE
ncbi:MAG: ATP synthase F1 subunit gamma [Parcubacteria group bacterium CG10_big_fil_rev_8_21_14_0_10_36_14]|nr:MAG: ATP synthase F1 subunit gamma [Parcubacteria group bacterium CG10_big_fil_rev_8_21_14_0_10_36_14]